jgi:hypothetical protein
MAEIFERNIKEGIDYEWQEKLGIRYRVFSKEFLLKKGYCCQAKCKNCPYTNKAK